MSNIKFKIYSNENKKVDKKINYITAISMIILTLAVMKFDFNVLKILWFFLAFYFIFSYVNAIPYVLNVRQFRKLIFLGDLVCNNSEISFVTEEKKNIIIKISDIQKIEIIYKSFRDDYDLWPYLRFKSGINRFNIQTSLSNYEIDFLSTDYNDDKVILRYMSDVLEEQNVPFYIFLKDTEYTSITAKQ